MRGSVMSTHWSEGGVVFYVDGKAWTVGQGGASLYLGKEAEVEEALKEGVKHNKMTDNPILNHAIKLEKLAYSDKSPEQVERIARVRMDSARMKREKRAKLKLQKREKLDE